MLKNSSYKKNHKINKKLTLMERFISFTKKVTHSQFLQIFSDRYILRQSLGDCLLILKHKSEAYLEPRRTSPMQLLCQNT